MNSLLLLQCLLFMDFAGKSSYDLTTEHCFAIKSNSIIRPFNRVCNIPEVSNNEIIKIKNFFNTTPFTWAVHENDYILSNMLEENGLACKFTFPAMELHLDKLKKINPKSEVTVKRATSQEEIQTWFSIIETVQKYQKDQIQVLFEYFSSKTSFESIRLYIGYYFGKPAAACMLTDHKEIVCLHLVSTLEEYRNKGIASALIYQSLLQAHSSGNKEAVLLTYENSKKIYFDLGFEQYAVYKMYGNYSDK